MLPLQSAKDVTVLPWVPYYHYDNADDPPFFEVTRKPSFGLLFAYECTGTFVILLVVKLKPRELNNLLLAIGRAG